MSKFLKKGEIQGWIFLVGALVVAFAMVLLVNQFLGGVEFPEKKEIILEGDKKTILGNLVYLIEKCWERNDFGDKIESEDCNLLTVNSSANISSEEIVERISDLDLRENFEPISIKDVSTKLKITYNGRKGIVELKGFQEILNGICEPEFGENCLFSDCKNCSSNICLPYYNASKIDEIGCVLPQFINAIPKGKMCQFDWECVQGLNCTKTIRFSEYDNACCPDGTGWNGNDCITLKGIGEECVFTEECKEDLNCNSVGPNFPDYPKACCTDGKHWNGTSCVFLEGERCNLNECDAGLDCEEGICKKQDKYYIVYAPIGYSSAEFESFKAASLDSFNRWVVKSPFGECPDSESKVEPYFLKPDDCPSLQKGCQVLLTDGCNPPLEKCVRDAELPKEIALGTNAVISGMCKGMSCSGTCGIAGGIPSISSVSNMGDCRLSTGTAKGAEVAFHEMGHSWGLCHIQLCGAICDDPRTPTDECQLCGNIGEEKNAEFIMDYCLPYNRYGPIAYDHLNKVFSKYKQGC